MASIRGTVRDFGRSRCYLGNKGGRISPPAGTATGTALAELNAALGTASGAAGTAIAGTGGRRNDWGRRGREPGHDGRHHVRRWISKAWCELVAL